jgi:hypothetical protein
MLKIFGLLVKISVFSLIVLVLGNWLRWDGKTISDQVRLKMSHAEESGVFDHFKSWTESLTSDAKRGFRKKISEASMDEEIPSSEKQKLKALIRELNSSQKHN